VRRWLLLGRVWVRVSRRRVLLLLLLLRLLQLMGEKPSLPHCVVATPPWDRSPSPTAGRRKVGCVVRGREGGRGGRNAAAAAAAAAVEYATVMLLLLLLLRIGVGVMTA